MAAGSSVGIRAIACASEVEGPADIVSAAVGGKLGEKSSESVARHLIRGNGRAFFEGQGMGT